MSISPPRGEDRVGGGAGAFRYLAQTVCAPEQGMVFRVLRLKQGINLTS